MSHVLKFDPTKSVREDAIRYLFLTWHLIKEKAGLFYASLPHFLSFYMHIFHPCNLRFNSTPGPKDSYVFALMEPVLN